jgi:hypothetical protein
MSLIELILLILRNLSSENISIPPIRVMKMKNINTYYISMYIHGVINGSR